MSESPYAALARRLIDSGAAHREPTRARELADHLRAEGMDVLATELDRAAARRPSWLGACTTA